MKQESLRVSIVMPYYQKKYFKEKVLKKLRSKKIRQKEKTFRDRVSGLNINFFLDIIINKR